VEIFNIVNTNSTRFVEILKKQKEGEIDIVSKPKSY
jgi:hypothetical protein